MSDRPREDGPSLAGRLYDCHGGWLYRYALLLLTDQGAAEDAVQQVFASILRHPPQPEHEAAYLRRAIRNECYSALRRRQRQQSLDQVDAFLEPVAGGAAPDERLAIERALRAITPEQREVIHLHVFEGWTFQEIADAADVSLNTVASRYRYAIAKLRQVLTAQ